MTRNAPCWKPAACVCASVGVVGFVCVMPVCVSMVQSGVHIMKIFCKWCNYFSKFKIKI